MPTVGILKRPVIDRSFDVAKGEQESAAVVVELEGVVAVRTYCAAAAAVDGSDLSCRLVVD